MSVILVILSVLVSNILGLALPALVAAWLFTLVLPVPFDQMLWLSLGVVLVTRYTFQSLADMPGVEGINLVAIIVSVGSAFIFLALSSLLGWLLIQIMGKNLTMFEAVLLFAITLSVGFYFMLRSGTGGLPLWMTMPEGEDESFEEDYVVTPPKRRKQRRRRTSKE